LPTYRVAASKATFAPGQERSTERRQMHQGKEAPPQQKADRGRKNPAWSFPKGPFAWGVIFSRLLHAWLPSAIAQVHACRSCDIAARDRHSMSDDWAKDFCSILNRSILFVVKDPTVMRSVLMKTGMFPALARQLGARDRFLSLPSRLLLDAAPRDLCAATHSAITPRNSCSK